MNKRKNYHRHEVTWSNTEKAEEIQDRANALNMTVGQYIKFAINKELQRREIDE